MLLSPFVRHVNKVQVCSRYVAIVSDRRNSIYQPCEVPRRGQSTTVTPSLDALGNKTTAAATASSIVPQVEVKVSKAMRAYLQRAKEHDEFMKVELAEYEIGKRHLANMMGENPETFTQDDIDRAIEYLMPSGIYDSKARPSFQHPSKLYPKRKAAEFDYSGRPFHHLFYTGKPQFYENLYAISQKTIELNNYEDKMISAGVITADENQKLILSGIVWFTKVELENHLIEKLTDNEYELFLNCIKRLVDHPYSVREKEFITTFSKPLIAKTLTMHVEPLKYDDFQRPYMSAIGLRKRSVASVTVRGNGTGKITINDRDITFFERIQDREQLMFPLQLVGRLNQMDVEARVQGIGDSALSGAIRHGLSQALCSFVTSEEMERLRLAGLLTRDPRFRERKKPGQEGARRKFTWKKR